MTGRRRTPSGNPLAANPFAYVGDNPLVSTDPSSHCSWYDLVCGAKKTATATVSAVKATASYVDDDFTRPASFVYNAYVAPKVKA